MKKNINKVKNGNYIKLTRQLLKHDITSNEKHFRVFIFLLLLAAFKEHWIILDGRKVIVQKGTICTTWKDLSSELKYPIATTRYYINILCGIKYDHIIIKETSKHYICIRISNYSKWQSI